MIAGLPWRIVINSRRLGMLHLGGLALVSLASILQHDWGSFHLAFSDVERVITGLTGSPLRIRIAGHKVAQLRGWCDALPHDYSV